MNDFVKHLDFTDVSKTEPIAPYVECDGWYTCCYRCNCEVEPTNDICPNCGQKQDWSWYNK